jgi:hypothetical protein
MVVQHENFQMGVVAVRERSQAGVNALFLISSGNQHGNKRGGGRQLGGRGEAEDLEIKKIVEDEQAQASERDDMEDLHERGMDFLGGYRIAGKAKKPATY